MVKGDINASLVTFNLYIYSMFEVVCFLIGVNRYVFAKCCSVGGSVIPSFRLLLGCPKPLLTKHNTTRQPAAATPQAT